MPSFNQQTCLEHLLYTNSPLLGVLVRVWLVFGCAVRAGVGSQAEIKGKRMMGKLQQWASS